MTKPRVEPLVWLMFSGGGVMAAVLLPVLVLLFAFAVPFGWVGVDYDHLRAVLGNPLTVLVLLGVFVLLLVHSAHRFRYTVYDGLQVKSKAMVALLCYGVAAVGSFLALRVLLSV
jgi:fumarate reductase subunit D